ncbi:MAG: 23S rRNA (adenine(2503)-C(2))-methyltransferase RlmN [Candidatus Competibacteraceae bacterium]|nr:23S rRNA (adenine(2503)-C(2))-methyltransferase RlmN [Candidatus Competibacteraceae bacterium]
MQVSNKTDIRRLSADELKTMLEKEGQPAFRTKQIFQWLWQKGANSFDQMSNLPQELRAWLNEHCVIYTLKLETTQKSDDGTIKSAFSLYDGKSIEGVLIPSLDRITACISSQVGCSLQCTFCATAQLNLQRNLSAGEIFDQVVFLNQQSNSQFHKPISNIVIMGMGEPLLNYKSVMSAINHITSPDGLGMSPRRITLSTSGIAKMIKQLADDNFACNLALSLHAADNVKRSQIMPINDSNSLEMLANALKYFYEMTHTRITYEYVLLRDFNDSMQDAKNLALFCRHTPCKVNIIEFNPVSHAPHRASTVEKTMAFIEYLQSKNIIVNMRRSRGKDIDAACGQLANKLAKKNAL